MEETGSNWPRLLSLAVHEFRTPVTVVAGYLRMLLKDRAGPLADPQRRLLEEAEKSCSRLSTLLTEMSELGQLLDGRESLARGPLDLNATLRELPTSTQKLENQAGLMVEGSATPLPASGDARRLRRSIEAIALALRREIIDGSDLLIKASARTRDAAPVAWIAMGTRPVVDELSSASADNLGPFDDWRGGVGLTLPLARRVIEMHGGRLMALTGERQKAGGVIELPLA